jgi:hypothetical protein
MDRLTDLMHNKQKMIPIALIGIAVFSGVAALAKTTGYFLASSRAVNIVTDAIARSESDPNVVEAQFAKAKPLVDDLKKNNLFAPAPKKEHPIKSVMGIFGDEAFINNKWYKVGAKVGDAEIVAIGPDSVTAKWEGKEKVFRPIDASGEPTPGGPGGRPRPSRPGSKPSGPGGGADMVVVRSATPQMRGQSGGSGPRGGPDGGFRGRFSEMSEAQRERMRAEMQKARERYSQMSEKEREKFRAEMRERFGGGRGGRR